MKKLLAIISVLALVAGGVSAVDHSVTAASVALLANTNPGGNVLDDGTYTAAATITAGQAVYVFSAANKTLKPANAATSSATAAVFGIALNGASSGQPVRVLRKGIYNPGFTGAASTIVILSGTDGGLCPTADLDTGERAVIIGVMSAASTLMVDFTGYAHATSAAKP